VVGLHADGQVVEVADLLDHGVGVEQDLVVAEVGGAGRHHEVALLQRPHDVQGRHLFVAHLLGVEVDQNGPVLAADDDGGDHTLDAAEHVADVDAGDVLDVGLVKARVADGEDAQRHGAGRVEGQDDRRQGVGGQGGQGAQGQRVGGGQGRVGVDVVAEVDLDDADAGDGARLDGLGAGGLAGPAFDAVGDGLLDGGGRHAVVVGEHLHGGCL